MTLRFKRNIWTTLKYLLFVIFSCNVLRLLFEPNPNVTTERVYWPANPVYTLYYKHEFVYPMDLLPENDYNTLLDFYYTFRMPSIDINQKNLLLIVLVHSNPWNFENRRAIRETWGGYRDDRVKVLFALGAISTVQNLTEMEQKVQNKIEKEHKDFGDLIQGTFLESNRNMTYKHVMVLKYVIYHAPQAKYILKTDDDEFINIPTMINFLTGDLSPFGGKNMLMCDVLKNVKVKRTYGSYWRVSFQDYPHNVYPPHCTGGFILYSQDVVFKLYRAAQAAKKFLWIDNVHITGTLAQKTGINHTDIKPLMMSWDDYTDIMKYTRDLPARYVSCRIRDDEPVTDIRRMWDYVDRQPVPESLLKYVEVR